MTTHKDEIVERLRDVRCNEVSPCLAIWTDEAADLIEQQASTIERMGWQPIETAPKDSTEVLATPGSYRAVTIATFDCDCWSDELDDGVPMFPTHWMHLPEPPALTNKER